MNQKSERPSEKTGPIEINSKRTFGGTDYVDEFTPASLHSQVGFWVTAKDWVKSVRNTRVGFCSLVIEPVGLEIKSCMLHVSVNSAWVTLPGKESDENGERKWQPFLIFSDKEKKTLFQKMAREAVALLLGEG